MAKSVSVEAVLFDMDGTLIDSTPGVLSAWAQFSADYNLGDSLKVAHETHGRRLYDTLREYCGIKDEEKLQSEIDRFEELVIQGGPIALPGALELVKQYAPRAIRRAGLPTPKAGIITSNDVQEGKPHPAPYLAGARKCGVDPTECLVVEDAISGLKAGKAAGAKTLAVTTTTAREPLSQSGANSDFIVKDLTKISVTLVDGRLEFLIDETE
ncbi:hypothetical protein M378DRAFT_183213 [Amanita muscaria Koide BX008]|uniref:Uncharacterized protein n=1 Tax=Amanita muscaria (strain Koide BX008) TaxID=946122 RepID=A0A0C2XM23_AMAMK|nr:hypothetical protein M378DRAFT_183213 [Amanita muscaria Koide BX008]